MRARTAVLCSVADQGVAALTNILVLVAAARLSTVADFARFSAVYLVFTVLLGVSGAYTGQPLVLRRGEGRRPGAPAVPPSSSPSWPPPRSARSWPPSASSSPGTPPGRS